MCELLAGSVGASNIALYDLKTLPIRAVAKVICSVALNLLYPLWKVESEKTASKDSYTVASKFGSLMREVEEMLRSRNHALSGDDEEKREILENDDTRTTKSRVKRTASTGAFTAIFRSWRYQWSLLSIYSRVALSIAMSLLTMHVVLGTLDVFFHYYGLGPSHLLTSKSVLKPESSFAVVINTFKRPVMLREAVSHYAETCGRQYGVAQVFVVWAEQGTTPPDPLSLFTQPTLRDNERRMKNRASVSVLQMKKDSLNSRFEPIEALQSTAIFMVDDDVRVSCPALYQGFQAWNSYPDAMVGYHPRLASPPRGKVASQSEFVYHGWPIVYLQHRFNFVLTKAAFLHNKYLSLYSNKETHPQEILDYVDQHKNCEDVAMSMLVANHTRTDGGPPSFPIYVEGDVTDKGLFGGISTGTGHMTTRSTCLTDLTHVYEKHGWGSPLAETVSLKDQSWVHHSPGFWWQYRPSNIFEWAALGNTLS